MLIRQERFVIFIINAFQLDLIFIFPMLKTVAIHNIGHEREEEIQQLRTDLSVASARCFQLEEANCAWKNYQHQQIESLSQKLKQKLPTFNCIENSSLDVITEQLMDYFDQSNAQQDNLMRHNDILKDEIRSLKQQLGNNSYLINDFSIR